MNNITVAPLRNGWKIDEDSFISVVDQIRERVRSESWYTYCKGYPLIKVVKGRAGKPILV